MKPLDNRRARLLEFVRQRALVVGVTVVFAGLGLVLLSASKADTPVDGAVASLALAPADIAVQQGDIVNIAVIANTNGQLAKQAQAVVRYPAGILELQSVQQACIDPAFTDIATQETETPGKLVVGCKDDDGSIDGQHTLAILVFKATSGSSSALVDIDSSSYVARTDDGQDVLAARQGSTVQLQPRVSNGRKQARAIANYAAQDTCSTPPPGYVGCMAQRAVYPNGDPISSPQATATAYGPKEIHNAYQLPCTPGGPVAVTCATPASYGPAIAIVDSGNYSTGVAGLESDLQTYTTKYGIPPCTVANGCLTVMSQTGSTTSLPPADGNWSGEIMLDVVAAHMVCQTCKIALVVSNDSKTTNMEAAQKYAATLKPAAISDSWTGTTGNESSFNHPGIPQIIADGDSGILNRQNSPADFPGNVVASGTTLQVNTDGTRASETLWSKSGGGCSPTSSAATWQTSLPNWSPAGCGTKRAYGDMSAVADPATGIAIYYQAKWQQYGGTSLSAPLIAAMFALAGPIPAATIAPSVLYANNTPSNFFDITSGSDCTASVTTKCTAGPGFDVPTGLGAPIGLGAFKTSTSTTPPTQPPPTTPPPTTPPPTNPPPTPLKTGDLNGDGKVNITDLSQMLSAWGSNNTAADLNKSGKVDISDLSILLTNFNK